MHLKGPNWSRDFHQPFEPGIGFGINLIKNKIGRDSHTERWNHCNSVNSEGNRSINRTNDVRTESPTLFPTQSGQGKRTTDREFLSPAANYLFFGLKEDYEDSVQRCADIKWQKEWMKWEQKWGVKEWIWSIVLQNIESDSENSRKS
jgi:hypothetical protein